MSTAEMKLGPRGPTDSHAWCDVPNRDVPTARCIRCGCLRQHTYGDGANTSTGRKARYQPLGEAVRSERPECSK